MDTSNGGKNVSFLIKDDEVWEKYEEIWDLIKNKLGIKFHSKPVYEQKYLKANVREFDGVIKANFLGNDTPKEKLLLSSYLIFWNFWRKPLDQR